MKERGTCKFCTACDTLTCVEAGSRAHPHPLPFSLCQSVRSVTCHGLTWSQLPIFQGPQEPPASNANSTFVVVGLAALELCPTSVRTTITTSTCICCGPQRKASTRRNSLLESICTRSTPAETPTVAYQYMAESTRHAWFTVGPPLGVVQY
jgi:hypothetical protein